MRLIDADNIKLNKDLPYKASVKRVLAQAPTVDAIPIEWLEKRVKRERRVTVKQWLEKLIKDYREEQANETD